MKKIAKCLIVDSESNYLVLRLNDHPTFGNDPDLPGGTMDPNETLKQTAIRETFEEVGIVIPSEAVELLYEGSEYSRHGSYYALYGYKVVTRPDVILSWEHESYSWLTKDELLKEITTATDTYMHMVADIIRQRTNV